jgi:hypothetical protein
MSVTLWLALLAEAVTVGILRHRLGRLWLRRPVTLLVLASVACQGLPAVLLAFTSVRAWDDTFRKGIAQGFTDDATLLMSAGMLGFTIAYLLTRPEWAGRETAADGTAAVRMPDWRPLALACAPLAILTYQGRGSNSLLETGNGAPLATSLAAEFYVILVVLTAFIFVLRHGHFLAVLLAQSSLLAATGERTPVLAAAITLIVLLCVVGHRPRSRDLHAAAAMTLAAILAITGLRAAQGRSVFYTDTGLGTRVAALGTGLAGLGDSPASGVAPSGPLLAQFTDRLDGDAFAGAILQAEHLGYSRLSAAYVPESLLLAVPSVAWPSKLSRGAALDPALLEMDDFGLQQVNFLPGLAGLYVGFLSTPWLIAFLAGLGVLCGSGERWLLRRRTPARLVLLTGAAVAALGYQMGLPEMLVTLRAAAVLAAIVWLAGTWRPFPEVRCGDSMKIRHVTPVT